MSEYGAQKMTGRLERTLPSLQPIDGTRVVVAFAVLAALTAGHVVAVVFLGRYLGYAALTLVLLPAGAAGWYFGGWRGSFLTLALVALNHALVALTGVEAGRSATVPPGLGAIPGGLVTVGAALSVGIFRQRNLALAEARSALRATNAELRATYDATIEGWSRALDLRDKETEGHSRRVTQLTLELARELGLGEAQLVQIRRGALLHDIGKMGVPDAILQKPGPLTEEEWAVMRRHPLLGRDLLAPIAFLGPALEIPYAHHERWDGTGYPEGLKGEQVPLAARIFAVADVYDALTSDRPYRPAWSHDRAREHIRASAGTHFDPAVVEVFLRMRAPAEREPATRPADCGRPPLPGAAGLPPPGATPPRRLVAAPRRP
ncbi:MAG TPA: HD-GYP domain-containing protein [Trueperaceae bacterium]|nr:HD-GYP domain-containing protein [Trueperaceae bacterium]